jgi:lipid II:glycine glycyltransferase (peptidoglycan interpeptide bridge formation enzyme)
MDALAWNHIVARFEQAHLLQTWEWGQVKARYGWQPLYLTWNAEGRLLPAGSQPPNPAAAALALRRTIPAAGFAARLSVLYVPKGPLLDWQNQPLRQRVLEDLRQVARRQGAIFIKIDPDVRLGSGLPGASEAQNYPLGQALTVELQGGGWRFSDEQVQFRNTVILIDSQRRAAGA